MLLCFAPVQTRAGSAAMYDQNRRNRAESIAFKLREFSMYPWDGLTRRSPMFRQLSPFAAHDRLKLLDRNLTVEPIANIGTRSLRLK